MPAGQVVRVAWEAVDKEALAAVLRNRLHQQADRDLHWHDLPLRDVALDQLALLAALCQTSAQSAQHIRNLMFLNKIPRHGFFADGVAAQDR